MATFVHSRRRAPGARWLGLVVLTGLSLAFGSGCGGTGSSGSQSSTGSTTTEGSGGSTSSSSSSGSTTTSSSGTGGSGAGGSGTSSSSSTSSSGTGTGGGKQMGCTANADCVGDPAGAYCDTTTGTCVACLPSDPTSCSTSGQYCDDVSFTCQVGCDTKDDCAVDCDVTTHQCLDCTIDDDCALGTVCTMGKCVAGCSASHGCPNNELCDPNSNLCVQCVADTDCAPGNICTGGTCVTGCSASQPCSGGATCCGSTCIDTAQDLNNCGACGKMCMLDHATAVCAAGTCTIGVCDAGYEDCDQNPANGCEVTVVNGQSSCVCSPGDTSSCYSGPAGTEGVGACQAGTMTCTSTGTAWGPCIGEVLPQPETCLTAVDDDCNGMVNETGTGCVCTPNATGSCYSGPAGTEGVGACKAGTWTCNADGTAWGPCTGEVLPAAAENCATQVDDNCDGQVNEGCACVPNTTKSCYSGPPGTAGVGVCKAGTQTCNAQGTGYGPCTGDVVPSADICTDSLDNDCNGTKNDGFATGATGCVCTPGAKQSCYTGPAGTLGVGVCKAGTQTCNATGTAWGSCTGEVKPSADVCTDNLDNDCNGTVNDGVFTGAAGCTCYPNDFKGCYTGPAGTLGVGPCAGGVTTCSADGKAWGACTGQVLPSPDSCLDSVDNDCNGVLNDGDHTAPGCACTPGTTKCTNGQQVYCQANGDWGPPAGPCVCTAGQFMCDCNQPMKCDIGPPAKWVPATSSACTTSQRCDATTGTCKTLAVTGNTTPTGTYYQFATFTTSNSVFKGGYDVDSYGDYIYVNRGGSNLDVYKVTLLDSDGDGLLEPNQHPSDPANTGPIEKRTLTFIQTYTVATDKVPMGAASNSEMYVTADAVYSVGPNRTGDITKWDFATKTQTVVAHPTTALTLSLLGFGSVDQRWYGAVDNTARKVWSFCPSKNLWVPEFLYPDLAGTHMDGLEVIVNPNTGIEYVYVSDMTSDFLAQYRKDNNGNWVQENVFKYNDATGSNVEGMGFGALNHFWITSGSILYEIGGGDLTAYLQQ